jgi:hypothetical protein
MKKQNEIKKAVRKWIDDKGLDAMNLGDEEIDDLVYEIEILKI